MKKIALITVHGMGETEENYADDFKKKLQSKLLPNEWDQVSFQPVYYQDLLQTPQSELFERTCTQAKIDWLDLRKFLLFGFSDAASLESSKADKFGVYSDAQDRIAKSLQAAYQDLGNSAKKVIIVAHSLGGQVISNYLWDSDPNHIPPANSIWNSSSFSSQDANLQEFLRLRSLHRLFTMGCNIPIFVAGFKSENIRPITPPNPEFEWKNYYDKDDVLGWPLKPLSDGFKALVQDFEINSGQGVNWFTSGTPLSHNYYWKDDDFVNPVVHEIKAVLS